MSYLTMFADEDCCDAGCGGNYDTTEGAEIACVVPGENGKEDKIIAFCAADAEYMKHRGIRLRSLKSIHQEKEQQKRETDEADTALAKSARQIACGDKLVRLQQNGLIRRVIKKGRPQRGWSKQYKCTGNGNGDGGCGAVLLVSEYDLYRTSSSSMGETDHHTTFCCMECAVETDVKEVPYDKVQGKRPSETERRAIALKPSKP